MESWLKTAEGLLQAVDKTAKAVSTATKQQTLGEARGETGKRRDRTAVGRA
jgi:hypothetical protein